MLFINGKEVKLNNFDYLYNNCPLCHKKPCKGHFSIKARKQKEKK